MPQLPSGRHIAIHAGPFEHFMQKVSEFALMREIVQMETISDVLDFVDVIFLVKSDLESNHSSEYSLADESFTPPPGFIALNSGFKLPDWEGMAKDWSAEDRAAMQEFLESDRCKSYFQHYLDIAKSQKIDFGFTE